ncbi:unnamed protein product [Penicillium olsonii]|nr:unnamed protein product [Penicillium olsonii]
MSYGSDHMPVYGPRSQIARPANKASDVDRLDTAKRSSRHRLSMLPRPNIATASPITPVSASSSSTQRSFSSVSTPETNPSLFVAGQQLPPKRLRNVLRRRAPTIGQHVEQSQSNKLSLVIPQDSQDNMNNVSAYQPAPTPTPSQSTTSYSSHRKNSSGTLNSASSKFSGPKELASLRTTVDTQNLPPPPTPFFSASPSTRYSVSPSIWSRGSTPTSLSSYSPGIVQSKIGRLRQPSPSQTRLPVFSPPVQASPQQQQPDVETESQPNGIKFESRSARPMNAGRSNQTKSPSVDTRKPHIPSSNNRPIHLSSPNSAEIDVAKARREVEEAEKRLFDPQGVTECSPRRAEPPQTPPRPSRDGTHRLELGTSPVVQSNLRYLRSTGHTRRESLEKAQAIQRPSPTPNQSASASIDSLHSRGLSQVPSRDGASPILSRKSPRTLTKEVPKEGMEPKIPVSKRFGLFSKKSKPDLADAPSEQTRLPRKGPTAGTGHEGYGKYGQRGRKASGSSSSGTRTRSTSTTRSAASKGSQSSRPELEIDDFLMSRLEPVIINGGGMDGASLSRTQSEQSMSSVSVASVSTLPRQTLLSYSTAPSTESLATSAETSGETLTPYKFGGMTRSKSPERRTKSGVPANVPKSRMPVPKGKKHGVYSNSQASGTSTSLSSQQSSIAAPSIIPPSQPSQPVQQSPRKPAKTVNAESQNAKKEKPSMWSFFHKSRGADQKAAPPTTAPPTTKLHAAITPVPNTRPIAHYALVDTDSDELDEIIKNIEDSPPSEEEAFKPVEVPRGLDIRKREPSVLLPSPPKMHGEFEKDDRPSPRTAMFNRNLMPQELESPERKPRRLASIGRIPQVVSRRDRHHRPAMQSFSRPFSGIESPSMTVPTTESMRDPPLLANATPHMQTPNAPAIALNDSPEWGRGFNPTFSAAEDTSALEFLAGPFSTYEFLQFPPKKDSTSSESSGALAAVTAVAPVPGSPPTEDEVWNEFDDLIDHVLSPDKPTPKPDETSKEEETDRFELATMASRALQDELNSAHHPQSVPSGTSVRSSGSSVHLRRSRIVSALQSSTAPSSQPSYSDLATPYGNLNDNMEDLTGSTEPSTTEQCRENQSAFLNSLAAVPSPLPKAHRGQAGPSEHELDAVTQTNIRSASMMTSRWLSFGRVLFSPAHNHVKAGGQGRILVVDGLGNDDWSFYCSLTYPDAEVYSLGLRPTSTYIPHPAAWQPPTNHHTVYHGGLGSPLPFPKDYFTVVVLRFPAVCSEAVQSNVVQECKRVLRTGGYLEMTLLDRDMVNMGPQTRKAIRQLKEMTYISDPTLCLKSTSDSIQREIGAQGFDSLRRCMVRIPVAGVVLRSSDSSSSTRSFSTTNPSIPRPTISITNTNQTTIPTYQSPDANISLGDLLSDPSSPSNDESIAKIVARVGRWWYSKCYEDPISHSQTSMWNDRKLLRECQKRGTGFRMFIAYAQKPSQVPRRTASV